MSNVFDIFVIKMAKIKYPISDGKKKCGQCGEIKTLDNFYPYRNYYRSYCKNCNLTNTHKFRSLPESKEKLSEYGKKYLNKPGKKERKMQLHSIWLSENKKKAVEYKGGCCSICGYKKCLSALEFHHPDPSQKERFSNSRGLNRRKSFENQKPEIDKCVLVCSNCHREIHENLIIL